MLHTMMHDSHGTFSSTSTSSISQPLPYIHALLPNETWNAIFQSLETSDLASVARVSHRWGAIAERVLYASVSICEDFSSSFQLPRKTSACCEGLARRPYLVEVVKSFHVRWTIDYSVIYTLNWESVLDDLANTLRSLAFLESLDLCLNLTRYWIFHSWDLLRHCHFPSLRHFSLTGMGYTPVAWFLNTTPSIRHLSLVDYRQNLALVPRALPLLCSFRGSPTSAASVVPGRPVQCIELVGQGEVEHEWINTARDAMSKMAMASLPVRYLDLSSMSVTPMLLSDISKHLSDLEVLKVRFALRHTLHFANTGIVSDDAEFIYLCR